MTDEDAGERTGRAFEDHEAFERVGDEFAVTTTRFDGRVRLDRSSYAVTVRMPMLSAAVEGDVGSAVEEGWFETLDRRLADATAASRHDAELTGYELVADGEDAVAEFRLALDDGTRAPEVAKSVVEFAEGTYLAGIVPGYEYRDPVAGMLSRARSASAADGEEGGDRGPLPL